MCQYEINLVFMKNLFIFNYFIFIEILQREKVTNVKLLMAKCSFYLYNSFFFSYDFQWLKMFFKQKHTSLGLLTILPW